MTGARWRSLHIAFSGVSIDSSPRYLASITQNQKESAASREMGGGTYNLRRSIAVRRWRLGDTLAG
jgi:hypothetical protein